MRAAVVAVALLLAPLALAKDTPRQAWVKAKCALCHGLDGAGKTDTGKKTNTPDLRTPAIQKLSDAEMIAKIAGGHRKMPAFSKRMDASTARLLVQYIRELK
jgi:mono/diheme cytochrome c family protein